MHVYICVCVYVLVGVNVICCVRHIALPKGCYIDKQGHKERKAFCFSTFTYTRTETPTQTSQTKKANVRHTHTDKQMNVSGTCANRRASRNSVEHRIFANAQHNTDGLQFEWIFQNSDNDDRNPVLPPGSTILSHFVPISNTRPEPLLLLPCCIRRD